MIEQPFNTFIGEKLTQIKVIGVGGGGCNAVDSMIRADIQGVDFIAANTDIQALRNSLAYTRIHLGETMTRGIGSGGSPVIGQKAAEESQEAILDMLQGSDMVFIAAGMGGGTGTGAAPAIAAAARDLGILTIAAVTRPFGFEGSHRKKVAEQGIAQLRTVVDTLIVIPNDRLLQAAGRKTSITEAFAITDDVLRQSVQGISDMIVQHGLINVDFGDVRAIMSRAGNALMGIGIGTGENRAVEAVNRAITSPLLNVSIEGAKGVLFNITGSEDLGIIEVQEAANIVARAVDPEANIVLGAVIDPDLPQGQVKITLIATGFDLHRAGAQRRHSYPIAASQEQSPVVQPSSVLPAARSRVAEPALPHTRTVTRMNANIELPPFLHHRNRK